MTERNDQLKLTPYTEFHKAAGAKMVPFAGYLMPVQYTSIIEEHRAVRTSVGLFDLTHMGEFEITGPSALQFLQNVTTNDVSRLDEYQIQYSCFTYPDGGIVDDLLVYRLPDRYMLVVNAANIDKDLAWLKEHMIDGVLLENRCDDISLLAIQGPDSQRLFEKLTDVDLDQLQYYWATEGEVAGRKILFSRTGYTGEDGFELYIPPSDAASLWNAVHEAGNEFNLTLCGLGARDTLRLEMRMALYGNDIDKTTNPYEAGLGWIVKLKKGEFIGAEALKKVKKEGPSRKLVCMVLDQKSFPRQGYDIYDGNKKIGRVTSGTVSPSLNIPIAMGYVPTAFSEPETRVEIDIRGKHIPARVITPPFYKKDDK